MSADLIDRPRLRASLQRISERTRADAASARMRPWVAARLEGDVASISEFEQYGTHYSFRSDESAERGGHDSAPSPMRYLLSSIAFCMLGWAAKTWAAADVAVRSLEAEVRTCLDLRGEHLVEGAPAHPLWFVVELRIDDDAPPEQAVALLREAARRCPTSSLVSKAVPLHLVLVQRGWTVLDTRPDDLRNEHREEQAR
ncbi:OsmC family protein [Agromyces binzhouensis]|uniref:OsmC family peroxiredoxin n=1 Tax=Agromyces binzhouensis TaxID=1817495 RepID=A0A4Q2JJD5_9MICO|nr:OsmC family protein [Agromyces binzhouensis]RXZ46170.1 OsmC family peroxiredoxin [Agromyces binzhouensis]